MTVKRKAISAFAVSALGLAALVGFEGSWLEAYLDSVGVPTICVGSTSRVRIGQTATPDECAQRLREDTGTAGKALVRLVHVPVTQGQYDALVSFTFNVGEGNLARSTLLRKLNAGQCRATAREFDRWVYAGGERLRGLVKRRAEERRMFEQDCGAWGE